MLLWAHSTADGSVSYRDAAGGYGRRDGPRSFVADLAPNLQVRVAGTAANAELLRQLSRRLGEGLTVQVGSPQRCPEPPLDALRWLWLASCDRDSDVLWYPLRPADSRAWALTAAVVRRQPEAARALLAFHPAWPALAVCGDRDEIACCQLLALIRDPRFFRHPRHPGRLSRLGTYLGLSPRGLAGQLTAEYRDRALLAVRAWSGQDPEHLDSHRAALPGGFLHRIWAAASSAHQGVLDATRRFLQLLVVAWNANRETGSGFAPAELLKREEERVLYSNQARHWRGLVDAHPLQK